jgi:hypothetical protein
MNANSSDFKITKENELYYKGDAFDFFPGVGHLKPLPEGKWEILGECKKTVITFAEIEKYFKKQPCHKVDDCTKYALQCVIQGCYRLIMEFYSLLASKELFWKNPMSEIDQQKIKEGLQSSIDYEIICELKRKYDFYQSKCLTDLQKILIFRKC